MEQGTRRAKDLGNKKEIGHEWQPIFWDDISKKRPK